MTENTPSFKSFNEPGARLAGLPPALAGLLAGNELFRNLDETDLREMSKFHEIPNIEGLAAHRVERPAPAGLDPAAATSEGAPGVPGQAGEALARELKRNPCVMVAGTLGEGSARPLRAGVIVPQSHAHLAQAFKRMMGPDDAGAPLDYTLFIWPEPVLKRLLPGTHYRQRGDVLLERMIGHWPGEGVGIVIGHDDPALPARMLEAAARDIVGEGRGSRGEIENKKSNFLWANPLVAAEELARTAAGRAAALAIGALPLGVEVDEEGRFPLFHGMEREIQERLAGEGSRGWVVVPRGLDPLPPVSS